MSQPGFPDYILRTYNAIKKNPNLSIPGVSEEFLREFMKTIEKSKPQKISLAGLSEDLMFQILNKMKLQELIRMRRTCSFVDTVAELNRKKLSSRFFAPANWLFFEICREGLCFGQGGDSPMTRVEGNFEKRVYGISFKTVRIDIEDFPNADKIKIRLAYLQIIEEFKKNGIVCGQFYPGDCPLDLIVPLINSVTWKDRINWDIFIARVSISRSIETLLSTLKQSEKCSELKIHCGREKINGGILEKVNGIGEVSVKADESGFYQLVKDIQNSKEKIRMKSVTVEFGEFTYIFFDSPCLPPLQEIHQPLIPLKSEDKLPLRVGLLTTSSQFVFIEKYTGCARKPYRMVLSFTDRNAAAFEEKLVSIYSDPSFNPADADDYFTDEEEEFDVPKDFNEYVRFIVSSIIE